ncbi:MAG: glycosyltransferase [Marinilabiliaceae bacterium]|nr:glycosyltransferase [Marinilabiliaceae bacterium]
MAPLITIVIPIYNVASFLPKCLVSCLNQSYGHLEIIAVNDGSTDNSLSILTQYSNNDKRIKIINKSNGGLNSARKAGIKASNGVYVTILDGDDYLEKKGIETLVTIANKNRADIVVAGANIVLAENGKTIDRISHRDLTLENVDYIKKVISDGPNTVCMKLYRKELLINNIEYPNIKAGQDLPLTIQWGLLAQKVVFTPEVIYNYVVARQGSTMSGDRKVYVEEGFKAYCFTFNILIKHRQLSHYSKELTNGSCAKLYTYLSTKSNRFSKNKSSVKMITNFIWVHQQFLNNRQLKIFILLLKINLHLAHYFVATMQKIKPTLNPYTK